MFIIHLTISLLTKPITVHVFTANHMTGLLTATLSLDQSNRSPGFLNFLLTKIDHLTLKMASAQVVETSVANNSPSQDSSHPDDHFQLVYSLFPCFKSFPMFFEGKYILN